MSYSCWDWCEKDHEHRFTDTPIAKAKRDVLTTDERESIAIQLGQTFRTRSEVDAHMKANNLEFVSQSGSDGKFRRDMHQWAREPSESRGPAPKFRR